MRACVCSGVEAIGDAACAGCSAANCTQIASWRKVPLPTAMPSTFGMTTIEGFA